MTIKIPQITFTDKILLRLGKRRACYLPVKSNRYDYAGLQAESFLRALLRPAGKPLPEGMFYLDEVQNLCSQSGINEN